MIDKDKIKEINSRRKPTQGFCEEEFASASKSARVKIMRNQILANTNISSIYFRHQYVSSSFDGITYQKKYSSTTPIPYYHN
ncbi:MAG: hypothetical protein ACQETL_04375 [Bacteroidota bacterium]